MTRALLSRVAAEFAGSLILSAVVIGSGIMAQRLTDDVAVALLGNTLASAAILYVLITALAPISGAHFNPAVTLVQMLRGDMRAIDGSVYAIAQVAGCAAGAVFAHAQFALPLLQTATTDRSGVGQLLGEAAATFALVAAILLVSRARPQAVAAAVALTIAAGYWWTSSTSFANPAITLARALSDTFAGIRTQDAPGFIAAQCAGALAAMIACAPFTARASNA